MSSLDPRAGFGRHGLRSLDRDGRSVDRPDRRAVAALVRRGGRGQVTAGGPSSPAGHGLTVPAGQVAATSFLSCPPPLPDEPPDAGQAMAATHDRWARGRAAARREHRHPRRPARVRGAARPDQLRRRHGRGGHHQPARAGRGRAATTTTGTPGSATSATPARRRPRRALTRCSTTPSVRLRRLLDDGPKLAPAYTVDGGRVPDQRWLDLPGYPGGIRHGRQLGEPAVPARRARRVAAAARRRGPARPAGPGRLAGGRDRR